MGTDFVSLKHSNVVRVGLFVQHQRSFVMDGVCILAIKQQIDVSSVCAPSHLSGKMAQLYAHNLLLRLQKKIVREFATTLPQIQKLTNARLALTNNYLILSPLIVWNCPDLCAGAVLHL